MIPNLIVPTLTRYDLLANLLDSIDYPVRHLLIINNGKHSPDFIRKPGAVKKMTWLNMPANLGVAGSWNLGIKSFPHDDYWFICSDDVVFEPGALEMWMSHARIDALTISDQWPFYQFFIVGEQVIDGVGLFDEGFFPANFEDDDFQFRCEQAQVPILRVPIPHRHVRQGTVFAPGLAEQNQRTYPQNEIYFNDKRARGDVSSGEWLLKRRREQDWAI